MASTLVHDIVYKVNTSQKQQKLCFRHLTILAESKLQISHTKYKDVKTNQTKDIMNQKNL